MANPLLYTWEDPYSDGTRVCGLQKDWQAALQEASTDTEVDPMLGLKRAEQVRKSLVRHPLPVPIEMVTGWPRYFWRPMSWVPGVRDKNGNRLKEDNAAPQDEAAT